MLLFEGTLRRQESPITLNCHGAFRDGLPSPDWNQIPVAANAAVFSPFESLLSPPGPTPPVSDWLPEYSENKTVQFRSEEALLSETNQWISPFWDSTGSFRRRILLLSKHRLNEALLILGGWGGGIEQCVFAHKRVPQNLKAAHCVSSLNHPSSRHLHSKNNVIDKQEKRKKLSKTWRRNWEKRCSLCITAECFRRGMTRYCPNNHYGTELQIRCLLLKWHIEFPTTPESTD